MRLSWARVSNLTKQHSDWRFRTPACDVCYYRLDIPPGQITRVNQDGQRTKFCKVAGMQNGIEVQGVSKYFDVQVQFIIMTLSTWFVIPVTSPSLPPYLVSIGNTAVPVISQTY